MSTPPGRLSLGVPRVMWRSTMRDVLFSITGLAARHRLPWRTGELTVLPWSGNTVIETFHRTTFDRCVKCPFDGAHHHRILTGHQGECIAAFGGATGPANPVDVRLGGIGDVVVDDVGDQGDVDPPRGDVRGDEYLEGTITEPVQRRLPAVLGKVPLERGCLVAGLLQLFPQALGPVLGTGEDQYRLGIRMVKQLQKQGGLEVLLHRVEGMTDGDRWRGVSHLHRDRVGQDLMGQFPYLIGHGGGEEKGLSLLRELLENPPDVGEKPHVEHLVRLVQDQNIQPGEVDGTLADMIQEPSGAGDNHLDSPLQLVYLGVDVDAAVDGDAPDASLLPQGNDGLMDLLRQFAGRGDDEGPDMTAFPLHETMQDRECEGSGLTGAGLGQPHDVAPLHDRRNCLGLDRGGLHVARRCNAGRHVGMEVEFLEVHLVSFFLCSARKKAPDIFRGLR